jgi:hypothetical protein
VSEKLKTFSPLFGLFQSFHLKNEKSGGNLSRFSPMFSVEKV